MHNVRTIIPSAAEMIIMKCPLCQSPDLKLQTYEMTTTPIPGHTLSVSLNTMECQHCGEQTEPYELSVANDNKIANTKLAWIANNVDLPGSSEALVRLLRKTLGLDQKKFADLVGATGNAISKYESGTIQPSSMAQKLLLLLAWSEESRSELIRHSANNADAFKIEPVFTIASRMPNILPSSVTQGLMAENVSERVLIINAKPPENIHDGVLTNPVTNYINIFNENSTSIGKTADYKLGSAFRATSRTQNFRTLSSVH